jgi:putative flippase GtrA
VGGIGFCVDGGLLTVLMDAGFDVLGARSVSFLSAVTCTWLLNRLWTFRLQGQPRVRREYASYLAAQTIGALINLAVFFVLIEIHPFLRDRPLIPLAFGAAVSLAFNYAVSRKYVFKG